MYRPDVIDFVLIGFAGAMIIALCAIEIWEGRHDR